MNDKFFLIISTGMPGFQRLLVFTAITYAFSNKILGEFSNDFAILQLVAFFTTVGWSALIMVRAPKSNENLLPSFTLVSIFYSLVSFIILYAAYHLNIIISFKESCAFILGWSIYQIARHYSLSGKNYFVVVLSDFLGLSIMLASIYMQVPPLISLSLSYYTSFFSLLVLSKEKIDGLTKIYFTDHKKSFEFAAGNFLTGSIILLLIPMVKHALSLEYAGFIGLVSAYMLGILLIPRALALYFIPDMARNHDNIKSWEILYKYSFLNLLVVSFASIIIYVVFYLFGELLLNHFYNLPEVSNITILLIFISFLNGITQPLTNYLMAKEKSSSLLFINIIYFLFSFIGLIIGYFYIKSAEELIHILLFFCLVTILRIIILYKKCVQNKNQTIGVNYETL